MSNELRLSDAWEQQAKNWIEWSRKPGHDSYWQFHRDQFLEIVPPPGEQTLDVGCGEGRLTRHLKEIGHNVRGFDSSRTMIEAARLADPEGTYECASAEALPVENECADIVVTFMVLHDVDDLTAAVTEIGRVLRAGGRACVAIVHPLNSAGNFATLEADSEFIISKTYLGEFRYSDALERDGLEMTFHSIHRPLERYSREFESAGLLVEAIREHPVPHQHSERRSDYTRWQRLPLFMHFRLIKACIAAAMLLLAFALPGIAQDAAPDVQPSTTNEQPNAPSKVIQGNVEQSEYLPVPAPWRPAPVGAQQQMPPQMLQPAPLPGNVQSGYVPSLQRLTPQSQMPGLSNILQGLVDQAQKLVPQADGLNVPPGIPRAPAYDRGPSPPRPKWIPLHAYSNDDMITAYHHFGVMGWDREPIPPEPIWMKLGPNVVRYWRGQTSDPCMILCKPLGDAPGNFIFASSYPGGPKGWLQYLDFRDRHGFPMYQYWFDPR